MATRPRMALTDDAEELDRSMEVALRLEPIPLESDPAGSPPVREPVRRVMLAVLADAIATFRRTAGPATRDDERTFVETVHWFASNDASDPLGFLAITHALGLDAADLREGLKSVRARALEARRERVLH